MAWNMVEPLLQKIGQSEQAWGDRSTEMRPLISLQYHMLMCKGDHKPWHLDPDRWQQKLHPTQQASKVHLFVLKALEKKNCEQSFNSKMLISSRRSYFAHSFPGCLNLLMRFHSQCQRKALQCVVFQNKGLHAPIPYSASSQFMEAKQNITKDFEHDTKSNEFLHCNPSF